MADQFVQLKFGTATAPGGADERRADLREVDVIEPAAHDKAADVLECLRAVPAARLVTSARAAQGWPGWTIILDGDVIPEQPSSLRDKGRFAKIPVLSGANEDEGGFFVAGKRLRPGPPTSDEDYAKSLAPVPFGDQILAAYPPRKFGDPDRTFASAVSDPSSGPAVDVSLIASSHAMQRNFIGGDSLASGPF